MYPAKPGLIIGFHGCDISVRNAVIQNKTSLFASANEYDWLGHGIYFWENNQQRALEFAEELKRNQRKSKTEIKKPAVVGAVIDMGFCLDLIDSEYLKLTKTSFFNLAETYKNLGKNLPENKTTSQSKQKLIRYLDCSVIENLHKSRRYLSLRPFDSVRGVFVEGEELYPNAGFNDKNHIQICIRNPNCIKGFFIPRNQDINWEIP